jgi:hypothetical protein
LAVIQKSCESLSIFVFNLNQYNEKFQRFTKLILLPIPIPVLCKVGDMYYKCCPQLAPLIFAAHRYLQWYFKTEVYEFSFPGYITLYDAAAIVGSAIQLHQ